MKEIKRITGLIEQKHKTIERLNADLANARITASGAGQHDEQLEALRAELRDIKAKAYIDGKPANTKSLDAKIETVAEQAKAAQEMADAARDANAIIERGIALEEAELESLSEQLRAAIRTEIITRHDEAAEKYATAITELGAIVAQMTAAERAWKHVVHHVMNENGSGAEFPRRGLRVLEDIRATGVRVPAGASRLADPKVAAEYGDSYDRFWYLPKWADPRTLGFGDSHVADIVDGLRKAGVETHAFVGYAPPAPEPQLKVRVLRGVIAGEPKVSRDPATDKVISVDVVEWVVGDDVMLDESQARALQRARMVAIHGEDEMPTPRPAGGPVEIDAALPKEEARRPSWKPEQRREYSGSFHSMDLSAYPD